LVLQAGDLVRIIFPVGSVEDPDAASLVMGDLALVLLIEDIKIGCPGWNSPPPLYDVHGALLVHGRVQEGQAYAIKITEQSDKYF